MSTIGQGLDVATEAQALLDVVIDHFTAAGVALPERRCLVPGVPGEVAWDCEQIQVGLQGIGWGPATAAAPQAPRTGGPASAVSIRHAVFVVSLVRCTPQARTVRNGVAPPAAEELHAAGLAYMKDAGLLSQALVTYTSQASTRLASVASVEAGVVEPRGPQGEFHAVETTLAITVGKLV